MWLSLALKCSQGPESLSFEMESSGVGLALPASILTLMLRSRQTPLSDPFALAGSLTAL
jgi:hypothetical protein